MMIADLKKLISNKPIENLLLVGFIDLEDDPIEFYPTCRFLYLKINNKFIEFESISNFSKLKISISDTLQYKFKMEKDTKRATCSISEIVLADTMADNRINHLTFYGTKIYRNEIVCDTLKAELKSGQCLFFDPSYHFGINIGGHYQFKIWKENLIYLKKKFPEEFVVKF